MEVRKYLHESLNKIIYIVIILIYTKTIVANENVIKGRQTFVDCIAQNGDKLIYNQHHEANGTFLGVQKETILYPEKGDEREYIITCIKVYDNRALTGPNEGKTEIISGGVGQNSVIIRVQSARSKGYDLDVEIWGRKI
ncbi:uncharacterized protein LOC123301078 [Chrysoperla carnea]|uniref:uncharacterized protein LOC123301078 n=1 Tax=Chrysoperla carnea TaxID=189513 RepID=UPI001D08DD6A|nr:uncharacterized protein LOC123301078 [Chrysoperla carnea]